MVRKVFVLGRPGSGKSAAVRYLSELADKQKQSIGIEIGYKILNDYKILHDMFLNDTEHRRFRPTEHGGFDVIDPLVRDEALYMLEQQAQEYRPSQEDAFIIFELGRPDYKISFKLFSDDFLQEAYYLFIATDYKTCLERVSERLTHAKTEDDYFLVEHILSSRYSCPYVPPRIKGKKITVIDNTGSLDRLYSALEDFTRQLLNESIGASRSSVL